MSQPRVPDDLWEAIEPLLPKERLKPRGGRPRIPDRAALGGIIFVLRTGTPWRLLPKELGCGSGVTCWRRLRDWQAAGVWEALRRREWPTRAIQVLQAQVQKLVVETALRSDRPLEPPAFLRLPIIRAIPPRIIGFGIWPVHLSPDLREAAIQPRA